MKRTSPLQSKVVGPLPPHSYGAPNNEIARMATSLPTEFAGATGVPEGVEGTKGCGTAQPYRSMLAANPVRQNVSAVERFMGTPSMSMPELQTRSQALNVK